MPGSTFDQIARDLRREEEDEDDADSQRVQLRLPRPLIKRLDAHGKRMHPRENRNRSVKRLLEAALNHLDSEKPAS